MNIKELRILTDRFRWRRRRRISLLIIILVLVAFVIVRFDGNVIPSPWIVNTQVLFKSSLNSSTSENGSTSVKLELIPAHATKRKKPRAKQKHYPQDIMAIGPFKYLENYKNPCFERPDGEIACLPYFYLAGSPKSGTTDLSSRITNHPDVSSDVPKETHWLTRKRFYYNARQKTYPTIDDYVRKFDHAAKDIKASGDSSYHPKIVGDCSASTMWDNFNLRVLKENQNLTQPIHTIPDFIHHLNPKSKIIVILRNPIDRLYSDYLYFTNKNKTAIDFHQRVQEGLENFKDCFKHYSQRHCSLFRPTEKMIRIYIGLYYYFIADFMRVFPEKQILVLKLEDYSLNMAENMKKVFAFLEIAPLGPEEMESLVHDHKTRNAKSKSAQKVGAMMSETRELLHEFYKPHNKKLEHMLNKKLWD